MPAGHRLRGTLKHWLVRNWIYYFPIAAVLVVITLLIFTIIAQSRHPEIVVSDQQAADGSITIERAFLTSDGFVAIHGSDEEGALVPSSIGHVALQGGLSFDVKVRLSRAVPSGTKLYAVVHRDTGEMGRYEFKSGSPAGDPIVLIKGTPAAASFVVL